MIDSMASWTNDPDKASASATVAWVTIAQAGVR